MKENEGMECMVAYPGSFLSIHSGVKSGLLIKGKGKDGLGVSLALQADSRIKIANMRFSRLFFTE